MHATCSHNAKQFRIHMNCETLTNNQCSYIISADLRIIQLAYSER